MRRGGVAVALLAALLAGALTWGRHHGRAAPLGPNRVTLRGVPTSLPADGAAAARLTASVVDGRGRPVRGDNVTFSVDSRAHECGSLSVANAATGRNGDASVQFTTGLSSLRCTVLAVEGNTAQFATAGVTVGQPLGTPAIVRIAGADRSATAVAISQVAFPAPGSARVAVLASGQTFADALAGGPLAAKLGGPLLLTGPAQLDPATAAELRRVLPRGATVFVLGGTAALAGAVGRAVQQLGYRVYRVAGPDRFATAVDVADVLGDPSTVLEATGLDFPDALAADAAAAEIGGVVLLTNGTLQPAVTAAYLAAHPGTHYAFGGPARVADPTATAIAGMDRYDTAALAAQEFFLYPERVGIADGVDFPDALAAGATFGREAVPVVLTDPASLPRSTEDYLSEGSDVLRTVLVFGGPGAVTADAATAAAAAG